MSLFPRSLFLSILATAALSGCSMHQDSVSLASAPDAPEASGGEVVSPGASAANLLTLMVEAGACDHMGNLFTDEGFYARAGGLTAASFCRSRLVPGSQMELVEVQDASPGLTVAVWTWQNENAEHRIYGALVPRVDGWKVDQLSFRQADMNKRVRSERRLAAL